MPFVLRWLPVAVWSAVILFASGDTFSAAQSGSLFQALLGVELPYVLHVLVRKLMHLVSYGLLGFLAMRAARADTTRPAIVSMGIVLAVAATDEWRQSLSAARTGTPWDVLLDVVGAAIAVGVSRAKMARP